MIVANRKPAGVPRPLPNPTAIGTLPVIAVIGAAFATAMKMTATMPTDPFFRPEDPLGVSVTAADSVDTAGLLSPKGVRQVPRRCVSVVSVAPQRRLDNSRSDIPANRQVADATGAVMNER